MSVEEDIYFNALFEEYSSLLTESKRDIFDMFYRLDLGLSEIAEIKGITRQSVADCVSGVRKQLLSFEEKLHLLKKKDAVYQLIGRLSDENKGIGEEIKNVLGES